MNKDALRFALQVTVIIEVFVLCYLNPVFAMVISGLGILATLTFA